MCKSFENTFFFEINDNRSQFAGMNMMQIDNMHMIDLSNLKKNENFKPEMIMLQIPVHLR